MTRAVKNVVQHALGIGKLAVVKHDYLARLREAANERVNTELLLKLPDERVVSALRLLKQSRSQLRQDVFVLSELAFKREGFFVECGAADGLRLSNTYLLEREFGWRGIVAEPARIWHTALSTNRKCRIETQCVWSSSHRTLVFNQVEQAELSTISAFTTCDVHRSARKKGASYMVSTISLLDLLAKHDAPAVIDYLSLDTEGSEFQILNAFDFQQYQFRVITCEHNFTPMRDKIYALLTSHGYRRKWEEISAWDDWYVRH